MQYGHFDDRAREYVIDRPDTPAPWANYLGSPAYGAIITGNAGGYSFVQSGANGRIMRYHFNDDDTPGRYIYLRDDETADYWSVSWQPVGKPLDAARYTCHHGTAYTKLAADYSDIHAEATYYVPLAEDTCCDTYEVWHVKVANNGTKPRKLSAFGYVEFTNESNYSQDLVNMQYSLFISRTEYNNGVLTQYNKEHVPEKEERFFALAGAPVESYCGDKTHFIGKYYTSYATPQAVIDGRCDGTMNYNSNPCGGLHTRFTLDPGQSVEFTFLFGKADTDVSSKLRARYDDNGIWQQELDHLKSYWHAKLMNFQVQTPNAAFNSMVNVWNAYQCFITFTWSRAASLIYCGERNGFGYRDTVQDIQGIIHLDPEMAKKQITFMLSGQVDNGAGLPLVKYTHNPGHEDTPDDDSYVRETGHPAYRADDAMWLFPTVWKYITQTGDTAYLDEVIPYANKGEDTVYGHLKKAIDFTMNHLGPHKMPAGLHADWNDCLKLGKAGESTFVAEQFYYAFTILKAFAEYKQDADYAGYLERTQKELGEIIQKNCWQEDRFIRGINEKGVVIGKKSDPEASMWLNPQSWAVISGVANREQTETALSLAHDELNTPYGLKLMNPSFVCHAPEGAGAIIFNCGTKENGGIFSQTQGWAILAEALAGHGNRAFEYYNEIAPACLNDDADTRVMEPYVHGQFTESNDSPFMGRSHVHWLTGTASTVMVASVEGICGIRPDLAGLHLEPSIPASWKQMSIDYRFRDKMLHIHVENPNGHESGCASCTLNGRALDSAYIKASDLADDNEITLVM